MAQLSASTLKLFQECPRCFWLHVNRKIERPRGPFPSLPSGMDRVLKGYFDQYRGQSCLPPLIAGKLEGLLSPHPLTLGFNDAGTGSRLWGKLDDCMVLPDGRLAPIDHKTRASSPDDLSYTQTYYQFQMDVYTLLLERNGHRTSRTAHVLYYFPIDGTLHEGFPFGLTVHTVATDPDKAYRIFVEGARCLAGPLPARVEACAYCRWAQIGASLAHEPTAPPPSPPPAVPPAGPRRRAAPLRADTFPSDLFS
jgi:hypothetical protein